MNKYPTELNPRECEDGKMSGCKTTRYKFTEEFIDKIIDANNRAPGEPLNVGPAGIRLDVFMGITFTHKDIERIK